MMNKRIKKKRAGLIINWKNVSKDPVRAAEEASGVLWALYKSSNLLAILTTINAIERLYWRTHGRTGTVLDPVNGAKYVKTENLEVRHARD